MRARLARARHDRQLIVAVTALTLIAALLLALPALPARGALDAAAATPSARLAVTDLRGHALVILETATGVTTRIALPGGPHELVALPDGRLVLSLEQSGRLAVVDLRSHPATVATFALGGLPHGLALVDDVLFVTDRRSDALRRIDVTDADVARWRELAPTSAGSWPHSIAVLADSTLAVAAARDSTLQIGARTQPVSELPESVAVAPGSGDVATAGALGGLVEVFDAAGMPLWSAAVGGRPVRVLFTPDGEMVAVALSAAHAIAFVGPQSAPRVVPVGGAPDGLAFDASGRWLFVGDLALGRVSVVDVERGAVRATFAVGESAGALLALPDGGSGGS